VGFLEYGREMDSLEATIERVRVFLLLGVFAGSALAFFAGVAVARRAMAPVGRLTRAAREIARTRDPAKSLPQPLSEDEVADLARTLAQMLVSLDEAHTETEGALARQREFVADASHELRTPLTSVLANLELLEGELEGEDREVAAAALRSARRMRRLVADLLLLARADAGRAVQHQPVDLGGVLREAAAEMAPLAPDHEIELEAADSVTVEGARDELHRVALNLVENAVLHTPEGTAIRAAVRREDGHAVLEVADDGPGIDPELGAHAFDRFVRGARENGQRAGTGLGLAIVRAVAERHGGTVELASPPAGGARFVVRLPLAGRAADEPTRPPGERQPA
jgi:signal transduction histidine kinase